MSKKILQRTFEETELENGSKDQALKVREILSIEKLNDTLKDIQSTLDRIQKSIDE